MLRKWLYTFYVFTLTILTSGVSFAADEASSVDGSTKVALALAAGFGIALAAFGGTLGLGRAASSALEGIARNPGASDKIFVPMIIALALIESLVIYALVISFMLLGKL